MSIHPYHGNGSSGRAPGPLADIRVLDLGTVYAGPITAMILGDFGADVLKIEHPRGDPARSHGHSKDDHGLWWKVIARNKRAVTLNFSHPTGRELLERLAADADVLVENFRPGVMEKWGLGPGRLHEINPGLVILRVTGFSSASSASPPSTSGSSESFTTYSCPRPRSCCGRRPCSTHSTLRAARPSR